MMMKLPFCSREFDPTEEELISHYLRNHILGLPYDSAPIKENAIVFGEKISPWDKFCNNPLEPYPWLNDSTSIATLFLFTRLSNVGNTYKSSSIQKNRWAGIGTWHGTSCLKEVYSSTNKKLKLGNYRILSFRSTNGEETEGQWTMYEYTISAEAFPEVQRVKGWQDQVICRIKRDDSKSNIGGKVTKNKNGSKKSKPVSKKRGRPAKSPAPASVCNLEEEEKEEKVVLPEFVNETVQEPFPVDYTSETYYGELKEIDTSNEYFDIQELLHTLGGA